MIDLLRDVLPLLISITIHPIAVTVAIVLAGRPGGPKGAAIYAGGFAVGVLIAFLIGRLFAYFHFGSGGHGSRGDLAKLDLAVGLIIVLVALWVVTLGREKVTYGYVGKIILKALPMTEGQLFKKGVKGAMLNPKDAAVAIALGAHLGFLDPGVGKEFIVFLVFVLLAILPMVIPAFIASRHESPVRKRLLDFDGWILTHLPQASSIVLLLMGLNIIRTALPHVLGRAG